MSVHPNAKNLTQDIVRRLAKRQPRRPKPTPDGFPERVKDIIRARAKGVCELDGCGPVEVIHHRAPRGNGGTSLPWINRASNGLGLSNHCHDWVEGRLTGSSRHTSYVNGWLVARNGNAIAFDVPVLYRGRTVLLRDNGDVVSIEGTAS